MSLSNGHPAIIRVVRRSCVWHGRIRSPRSPIATWLRRSTPAKGSPGCHDCGAEILSSQIPLRPANPDRSRRFYRDALARRAGPRPAAFRLRQAAHAARGPVSDSTMNETPAMITKMMNRTRSQPWNGCLAVVALAAATPANHAATSHPNPPPIQATRDAPSGSGSGRLSER